jgi:hypothetical protein
MARKRKVIPGKREINHENPRPSNKYNYNKYILKEEIEFDKCSICHE